MTGKGLIPEGAVRIREMNAEDLPGALEVEKACFSEPWSEKAFTDMLKREDAVYMTGKINDEVIAYMGACIVCDEAYINQVAVKREFRGENIGTALMLNFLKLLRAKSVKAVTLEVRVGNQAAIRMYEKCGFKAEGVRRDFYDKPKEDALILWNTSFDK